jgi:O-antigen/teichoic acid export membrane protein
LKSFLKSFGIYGLIPIFGKFIGILLMPMYTRLLTPADYGAQDILVQLAVFFTFLINIEIYHGTCRHFYDRPTLEDKKQLVSTGLWLTVTLGVAVMSLGILIHKNLYDMFFDVGDYWLAFYLMLIWAPVSALYTYLGVVMRYEKKPRLYFIITNVQLVIRITASIVCVAFLRMGVAGVLLGHIIGEVSGVLMLGIVLRKYFSLCFSIPDMKQILSFSLPLVPAVLLISFQKPLIRYLVANLLDINAMGYYTVAAQLASILGFVQSGLKLSWHPHLFEMATKDGFENEVKRIFEFFTGLTAIVSALIILNGKLLLNVLTTKAYLPAVPLIGFIVINSMIDIIRQISGCGPVLAKKTIHETYYEIAASAAVLIAFLSLHKIIGIVGLAIAFMSGAFVKFVYSWMLTKKMTKINFSMRSTYLILMLLFVLSVVIALKNFPYFVSIILSLVIITYYAYTQKDGMHKILKIAHTKVI